MGRVQVRPMLLNDAREHVLRCLPPGVNVDEAERLATIYTHDFLARSFKKRYQRPALDPDIELAIPHTWRHRLHGALDNIGQLVLRAHFGDGYPLKEISGSRRIHPRVLGSALEQLRGTARALLSAEGMELGGWSERRLDLLIRRIAAQAEPHCPGPGGLLSPAGEEHAEYCPRCSRTLRLIRWGVLSTNDLCLQQGQPPLPAGRETLLALLLHPDGRRHRAALQAALGDGILPAGRDAWLIPADDLGALSESLVLLAESGTPPRHLLRGAMVTGPARWSHGVLLGPLPVCALESARARPWSEVDGVGELPAPLPPPPPAAPLWVSTVVSGLLAVLAGVWALSPTPPRLPCPLTEVAFSPLAAEAGAPGGILARFDTDDLAVVDVVYQDQDTLAVLVQGAATTKGSWATGEGDFQLAVPGAVQVLLIASPEGVGPELPALLQTVRREPQPLEALARQLRLLVPEADAVLSPQPAAQAGAAPSPSAI